MSKKVFVGIQDGISDGILEGGLIFHKLTPELLFQSPGYRPYWIAEVTSEIWENWLAFQGDATVNYTGLNYTAWCTFWSTFTHDKINTAEKWTKWKKEHMVEFSEGVTKSEKREKV